MVIGNELDKSYEQIRQRFIHKLEGLMPTFESIEDYVEKANITHVKEANMQMHKIAGSAKTFGFPKLSKYAADVEHQLDACIESPNIPKPLSHASLDTFLSEAHKIITLQSPSSPDEVQKKTAHKKQASYTYTILVADDDELISDLLKQGLTSEACNIITAENGKEVMQYVKQHATTPLDLIILDVNMPKMDGFKTIKALKSDKKTQDIPVIMLTGRDDDSDIINGISHGALDYITKPFDVHDLVDHIFHTLKRSKTKILVADDDTLICDLLKHHFQHIGYSVIVANDGKEALSMLQKEKPNIAILDIMMPGMDGISVLQQAKKHTDSANIPIVMLTAKNQQENVLIGLKTGAHDYITKPFDVEELSARVSSILQRHNIQ